MERHFQKAKAAGLQGIPNPFGGFCFWGGDAVSTEDFKRESTAVPSADEELNVEWSFVLALMLQMWLRREKGFTETV